MKKIPRYQLFEEGEQEKLKIHKEVKKDVFLIKMLNKQPAAKVFQSIVSGEVLRRDIDKIYVTNNLDAWRLLFDNYAKSQKEDYSDTFINVISFVLKNSDNFLTKDNVIALEQIVFNYKYRVRDIEKWKPTRNNPKIQLQLLLQHLFAKYPVPKFLGNCFVNHTSRTGLYLHIGQGKSFKDYLLKPNMLLNKKVYNYLFSVPEHFSFYEGFRYAQVLSLGGTERFFKALMDSDYQRSEFETDNFWSKFVEFLINAPMFDYAKIHELVDYISSRKQNETPQNPFSLKHRTIASLLKQSFDWHQDQILAARQARIQNQGGRGRFRFNRPTFNYGADPTAKWLPLDVRDYHQSSEKITYNLIQLTTGKQLIEEGREMRHCVASYADSCMRGEKAIFSLRESGPGIIPGSLVTIEVRNYEIVQARGKGNKAYKEGLNKIIKKWAEREGLKHSKWI